MQVCCWSLYSLYQVVMLLAKIFTLHIMLRLWLVLELLLHMVMQIIKFDDTLFSIYHLQMLHLFILGILIKIIFEYDIIVFLCSCVTCLHKLDKINVSSIGLNIQVHHYILCILLVLSLFLIVSLFIWCSFFILFSTLSIHY